MKAYPRAATGAALVLACFAIDCHETTDDGELTTARYAVSELYASYGAFAEDGRLRIFAALLEHQRFLRLGGLDRIEVTVDGAVVPARERVFGDEVHYIVEQPASPLLVAVSITFVRGRERVGADLELAPAFVVKASPPSIRIGQSAEIDLEPRPGETAAELAPPLVGRAALRGECLVLPEQSVPLCGATSVPGQCDRGYPLRLDLASVFLKQETKDCSVNVRVRMQSTTRSFLNLGSSRQTFGGGAFDGHRLTTFQTRLVE